MPRPACKKHQGHWPAVPAGFASSTLAYVAVHTKLHAHEQLTSGATVSQTSVGDLKWSDHHGRVLSYQRRQIDTTIQFIHSGSSNQLEVWQGNCSLHIEQMRGGLKRLCLPIFRDLLSLASCFHYLPWLCLPSLLKLLGEVILPHQRGNASRQIPACKFIIANPHISSSHPCAIANLRVLFGL